MSRPSELRLRLFGRPSASWRGEMLAFPTRKSLAIVCYAAIAGVPVPRPEIAELLWERHRARALRRELHRLRGLPGASTWLEAESDIRVHASSDLLDFLEGVRRGDLARALEHLAGDDPAILLRGLEPRNAPAFAEWLAGERNRIEDRARDGLRTHGERLWRDGRVAEAALHLERAAALDPLDEVAQGSLARVELARGDVRAAQRTIDRYRRALAQELGVGATQETERLAREIERATETTFHAPIPPPIPTELLRPPVLAGREAAWSALERAWARRLPAFVTGPAGIGKSRLIMDFAEAKTGGNHAVLRGRPGDEALPYGTIARGFRVVASAHPDFLDGASPRVRKEMTHLVPDLIGLPADPVRSPADRARFRQAFTELLHRMAGYFDAFLADDMQFFDAASFHETGHAVLELYANRAGAPGRSVNAFRMEDMPADFVRGVQRMAAEGTAVYIELEPLDDPAVRELVASLGVEVSPAVTERLRRHTGGNPLYVVETLRGLHESGRLGDPEALHGRMDVPDRVARILELRLGRLSSRARRLAEILAAARGDATMELLASVADLDPLRLAETMGELERAQITHGLEFSHDLVHEFVARTTPPAVRHHLHARVATRLERQGAEPGRIAAHWDRTSHPERSLPWLVRAADFALARGLEDQARECLERVLVASSTDDPTRARAERIHARLGRPGAE